jgi:hypothetical protein
MALVEVINMEEKHYALIMIGIVLLSLLAVVFSASAYYNAAQANNKATSLQNGLAGFSEQAANTITIATGIAVQKINSTAAEQQGFDANTATELNNLNATQIAQGKQLNGLLANILLNQTVLASKLDTVSQNLSETSRQTFEELLLTYNSITNITTPTATSLNTIRIENISNTIFTTGNYFYGTMLPHFNNRFNISANQTVSLYILTNSQYANLALNKSYSTVEAFTGNQITTEFYLSGGCNRYSYVILGTQPFNLDLNQTAIYNSSSAASGVCLKTS